MAEEQLEDSSTRTQERVILSIPSSGRGMMDANAIDKWVNPIHHAIVTTKITLDKAGRVVIPKPLREQMQLAPGDTLQLESEGERITLRPVRPKATLPKEHGVWVYQGEASDASIPDLIDREREKRLRQLIP